MSLYVSHIIKAQNVTTGPFIFIIYTSFPFSNQHLVNLTIRRMTEHQGGKPYISIKSCNKSILCLTSE